MTESDEEDCLLNMELDEGWNGWWSIIVTIVSLPFAILAYKRYFW